MSELRLVDVFFTIQGEGANSGRRALFVRLPHCNLSCSWCDTKFDEFIKWSEESFIEFAQKETCRFAVITGGEPAMNKQTPRVIELLKKLDYTLAIETNGTFPIPANIDFVTISPKRDANYMVDQLAWFSASEFKYVVDKDFDFSILDRHEISSKVRYSLSPEWGNFDESMQRIIEYIKEHPQWRVSLQTHKFMKVP